MKAAYFDCFSGISGDMLIGALLDLGLDFNNLKKELGKLNLKKYKIEAKKIVKNGITATKFDVIENHKHYPEERSISEINNIIDDSRLDNKTKNTIKKIFLRIANAEAKIHNKPIDKIHFHEIGAIDTIIDVAGAVIGLKKLGIEKIYCSNLNVGTGFVNFSHGKFPVPVPATAEILKNVPVYNNNIDNMNPEIYPYVIDKLMENDALDAYLTSIIMKKGRPAIKLTVLCDIENTDRLSNIIFDET